MESSEGGRPAKRAKMLAQTGDGSSPNPKPKSKGAPKWLGQQKEYRRQQRKAAIDHPQPESSEHRRDRELFGIDEDNDEEIGLKPLQDEQKEKMKRLHFPKMFSQPSVITSGDKGIFVSCDKGREKKSLIELADLVDEYLVQKSFVPAELIDPKAQLQSRLDRQKSKTATIPVDNEDSPVEEEEIDIESSVNAELASMGVPYTSKNPAVEVRAFQLITLDIPSVSFLRFIPNYQAYAKIDPVDVAHSICADAASNPGRMRSRFIKRLCPVSYLAKVLSGGLEKSCEVVLPKWFKLDNDNDNHNAETSQAIDNDSEDDDKTTAQPPPSTNQPTTFAIRPNTRNNHKVSRDDVIKHIADKVQELGNNKHKVDLKGYQKGILVEIYRMWIGMSVVDNTSTKKSDGDGNGEEDEPKSGYRLGYEALKKFNLSEIYAEGLKEREEEGEGEDK